LPPFVVGNGGDVGLLSTSVASALTAGNSFRKHFSHQMFGVILEHALGSAPDPALLGR
jgi:hypothetical protein